MTITSHITPAEIRAALALPPVEAPARRLPKEALAQHGAANAADRKLIESGIERLDWWATLNPQTVGIAAGTDAERPVPAIQLLALVARGTLSPRLPLLIHRAIPVPVILLTALPGGAGTRLSLAPLRAGERIAGQMVVERLLLAPDVAERDEATAAFLHSLALPGLPQTNLTSLYGALVERVEALSAARITGGAFRLPADGAQAAARREALARHGTAEAEWLAARTAARRERRLAAQVALGEQARALKERLTAISAELAPNVSPGKHLRNDG